MYFGLQNYYECWVGNLNHIDVETRRLPSKSNCWSKNPLPFACNPMEDHVCVGKPFTMVIYEVTCACISVRNNCVFNCFLYICYFIGLYLKFLDSSYIIPKTEGNW